MKRRRISFGIGVALALCLAGTQAQALTNGDFSDGLTGWTTDGLVSVSGGVAALTENDWNWYSSLYQADAIGPGSFVLEFDFLGELSDEVPTDPDFAFPDVAFASLYFGAPFSADVISLFDLDYFGLYNVAPTAEITSDPGTEWQHFSMPFDSIYASAIPTFELLDYNYVASDSAFSVDNVAIRGAAPIPEPGTLVLLGTGLVGVAGVRRRRRR